ncbi:MAG: methylenetetrahydrofolate reductase, partial [Planctomycetota bacterium]
PEYLVAWGRRALRNGATLLGGCCGTTPDHIRALRTILTDSETQTPAKRVARRADRPPKADPVPKAAKSRIARAFVEGRFVQGVEVPAPHGWQAHDILATAHRLAKAGVDFMSLPEGARHGATLPPAAVAQLCWSVEGLDTIVFYSCRARQLHRIQSDLLGAHATGTRNLMLVTGDPSSAGADATPDLDIDSIGAVNLANALNHGEDVGGGPIGKPTAFHVGVRLDPVTWDLSRELGRLNWKVQAGADFAITSPVFDPEALRQIMAQLPDPELPVIATVWPLQSAREAEFFEQELANVPVPEPLIERMRKAEADGTERATGIEIARELAAAIKPMVAGIQVVAPDGTADTALAVLAEL